MDAGARRVTDVRAPRRGSPRRVIYLDGEPWREMNASVVRALALQVDDCVDPAEIEARARELEPASARERAFRLLGYRDRSSHALVERLVDDGYPREVARAVADDLAARGLVDDARYAESTARALVVGRGLGRRRALRELASAGVPDDLASAALDACSPAGEEETRALELARRLMRPRDTQERLAQRLVRRGFVPDHALRAAREALGEAEAFDAPDDFPSCEQDD